MNAPRSRILDLIKIQCNIFSSNFNPEGIRMGNKVLRQRLRGDVLAAYYPKKEVTSKEFNKTFAPDLHADNDEDFRRRESNHQLYLRLKSKEKTEKKKGR